MWPRTQQATGRFELHFVTADQVCSAHAPAIGPCRVEQVWLANLINLRLAFNLSRIPWHSHVRTFLVTEDGVNLINGNTAITSTG